jgi:hypothetical protein
VSLEPDRQNNSELSPVFLKEVMDHRELWDGIMKDWLQKYNLYIKEEENEDLRRLYSFDWISNPEIVEGLEEGIELSDRAINEAILLLELWVHNIDFKINLEERVQIGLLDE